jgi:hypothetical protein
MNEIGKYSLNLKKNINSEFVFLYLPVHEAPPEEAVKSMAEVLAFTALEGVVAWIALQAFKWMWKRVRGRNNVADVERGDGDGGDGDGEEVEMETRL